MISIAQVSVSSDPQTNSAGLSSTDDRRGAFPIKSPIDE